MSLTKLPVAVETILEVDTKMPKFKSTEASLYNGISQQSSELRLPSQVEDVTNANLTLSRGIEMRPPAEILLEESGEYSVDSLVYPSAFSSDLSYIFTIAGDGSTLPHQVYDTDGLIYPIIFEDAAAQDYLETDNGSAYSPIQAVQLSSILDYTFVSNKNVTPAMETATTAALVEEGYIWIKNGVQQVQRKIVVNGTTVTHVKNVNNDSDIIVDYFVANIPSGFTATKISSAVLKIVKDDAAAFTLTATDSYSDTTMAASRTNGCKIEDLPPVASTDTIMTIAPEENSESEYFLQYDEDTKTWSETTAPGESATLDNTTMPHAFIRMVDDGAGTVTGTPDQVYFHFDRIDWVARTSGGNDSAPVPSFITRPINDTFFFKNRLGFIAGDNIILSATDDLFRFFPTTVKEVLDDDPIDIAISSTTSVTLLHVSTFPESLIIVGDNEQFTLGSGGKAFTPENVVLDPTTSYSASDIVPPVTVGSTMYFIAPQSSFSAVREYSVQPDTLITDAADVTAHVPRLIPNNLKQIVSENNLEYLFLINTDEYSTEGNQMFIYKFYWQGNEKVQSAWIKWDLWFKPLGGITFDGKLILVGTEKTSGVSRTILTSMNLSDKPPVVLDTDDREFKSTRPNIDRQSTIPNEAVNVGNQSILEVTLSQYNYLDIDDVNPVVVDRISGIKYQITYRYTAGGKYYLVLEVPANLTTTDLGVDEYFVLGNYALGGVPPDSFSSFPLTFPFVFS